MQDNSTPKYEARDAWPPGIWLTGAGLVLCCVLIFFCVAILFHAFQRRRAGADLRETNVAASVGVSFERFPGPRLQVAPELDLATFRSREESELTRYGWIDRKAGVVRIPVERAMDLVAQRGLPFRGQPGAPAPSRTVLDMQQVRPQEWATPQPK